MHVIWPITMIVTVTLASAMTAASERTLLLALPAFAAMAACALPTLQRSVTAWIDWFTLLFFTGCGVIIWVVWLAMQTGWPPQPAANVARLAPGFTPAFEYLPLAMALAGSALWVWLVHWRAGRHRTALWKSLVLPSAGAALCWLLLMTLWLPLLNYARSYVPLVEQVKLTIPETSCVAVKGLNTGQIAALKWHGTWRLENLSAASRCEWLLVDPQWANDPTHAPDPLQWARVQKVQRPTRAYENLLIYRQARPTGSHAHAP
jgi:4-amino-4-deoxy-L-arabinose transferase-like glycosyltransferase